MITEDFEFDHVSFKSVNFLYFKQVNWVTLYFDDPFWTFTFCWL